MAIIIELKNEQDLHPVKYFYPFFEPKSIALRSRHACMQAVFSMCQFFLQPPVDTCCMHINVSLRKTKKKCWPGSIFENNGGGTFVMCKTFLSPITPDAAGYT